MKAFKGFNKDLTCLRFQFKEDIWNETAEANCYKNGFHCAENPLDCLSYYPNTRTSVYYIVEAAGDLHEDGSDTKISCTRMRLLKKLSIHELVFYGCKFIYNHPDRNMNRRVQLEKGEGDKDFCIVRGKDPIAKGPAGSRIYLLQEEPKSNKIKTVAIYEIDGIKLKADTYYGINGEEGCEDVGKERITGNESAAGNR